ncbi:MAG: hypothetical protein V1729_02840 [Candidatus Woesearchaeota archaeon]
MIDRGVLVLCKKCGKKVNSTEFILDPVYRMMVCRNCNRDRIAKEHPDAKKKVEVENSRPAGWDAEDELLNKRYQPKKPEFADLPRVSADKVRIRCRKCGSNFNFNTEKHYPLNCPNCGTRISS